MGLLKRGRQKGKKAAAVLEDGLEELLTYDDLFLEYFNVFLALPAFPVRLRYDPLLGKVEELDGFLQDPSPDQHPDGSRFSHDYGASDAERERTLQWLKKERFPPFKRTVLYLEYKLAKLLVRPLQDPRSTTRHSIRGRSRQADSVTVSSIPSHPSTKGPWAAAQDTAPQFPMLSCRLVIKPPSRTRSTPAILDGGSRRMELYSMECYGEVILGYYTPWEFSSVADNAHLTASASGLGAIHEAPAIWKNVPISAKNPDGKKLDLQSFQISGPGHTERDTGVFPKEDGRSLHGKNAEVEFEDSGGAEEFPPLQSFTRAALQRMKEEVLGTKEGLDSFQSFLQDTQGIHLLHFWMDCEDFRERSLALEANGDHPEARHLCAHLFRCILDKHRLHLTPECQVQIRAAQEHMGLTFPALSRSQYDALRRLRSYWVPRFLIHYQRSGNLRDNLELSTFSNHLPPLSTSRSHPAPADLRYQEGQSLDQKGRTLDLDRTWHVRKTPLLEKLLVALERDREAGSTFLHYLTRYEEAQMVHNFLLWRDLEDYRVAEALHASQQLLHRAAWSIHNKFLRGDAPCAVGLAPERVSRVHDPHEVVSARDGGLYTSAFAAAAHHALNVLRIAWLRYLSYDISSFLESCVPASYFALEEEESDRDRGGRGHRDDRAKKRRGHVGFSFPGGRGPHRKKKPRTTNTSNLSSSNNGPHVEGATESPRDPTLELLQTRAVFNVYRKAVQETESVELQGVLDLLLQLEDCREPKAGKRRVGLVTKFLAMDNALADSNMSPVHRELWKKLTVELTKGKISTQSLDEMGVFLYSLLADSFGRFWKDMLEGLKERGVHPSQVSTERWARLEPLLHAVASKLIIRRLKKRRAKMKHAIRAWPTTEDRALLSRSLEQAAQGWPTLEMLHFLKYLQTFGPVEELPLLENHLRFCLEVQKYKNAHHDGPDKALLKKKAWIIRDCFFTSKVDPSLQLEVDVEVLQRAIQEVGNSLKMDVLAPGLFDELHESVFASLLPFWAGFRKMWATRSPASAQRPPVLRTQHLLKKRLALFAREEQPEKTFHLPPLPPSQEVQRKQPPQPRFTYTFTVSKGLNLKDDSMDDTEPDDSGPDGDRAPGSRKTSVTFHLPPIAELVHA